MCLQIIACKLHNSLFVSFPKRKLRERYWTAVQYIAKFRVLPRDLSFLLTNFLWLKETSKKNRPLFKRIIARYAMKFHANFLANYCRKITGTKNEIRAFRLHYFCTVLYMHKLLLWKGLGNMRPLKSNSQQQFKLNFWGEREHKQSELLVNWKMAYTEIPKWGTGKHLLHKLSTNILWEQTATCNKTTPCKWYK